MRKRVTIMDRVHEHITLPDIVVQALDTPQVQRLRGLRQLGVSSYLYPSATHSRFEHSIGVAHLGRVYLEALRGNQPELGITDRDVELLMLAGLCHDLGHGPFSHLFEDVIAKHLKASDGGPSFCHEDMSLLLARRVMEDYLQLPAHDVSHVLLLIQGRGDVHIPYHQLISNKDAGIDVDRLDYFIRDSTCCFGKPAMDVRVHRLFNASRLVWDTDAGRWCCAFEEKLAFTLRDLFALRAKLHKEIYQHRVVKAVGHMIGDAFRLAAPHLCVGGASLIDCVVNPDKFLSLGDWILDSIEHIAEPALFPARQVIQRLRRRELYRLVGSQSVRSDSIHELLCPDRIASILRKALPSSESTFPDAPRFIVDTVTINQGRGSRDPLKSVRFYNPKRDASAAVELRCLQDTTDLYTPRSFEEKTIVVFDRGEEPRGELRSAFEEWRGAVDREGLSCTATPSSNAW